MPARLDKYTLYQHAILIMPLRRRLQMAIEGVTGRFMREQKLSKHRSKHSWQGTFRETTTVLRHQC